MMVPVPEAGAEVLKLRPLVRLERLPADRPETGISQDIGQEWGCMTLVRMSKGMAPISDRVTAI
jgi:hypothetical protein